MIWLEGYQVLHPNLSSSVQRKMSHGEEGESPMHGGGHAKQKVDLSFNPEERAGLSNEQAEELTKQWGYNELPEIKISLYWLLFVQFTGTMPYMLELACIVALAVGDYPDFAIILAMLLANGFLGFHEQLKAAESLVSYFLIFLVVCTVL